MPRQETPNISYDRTLELLKLGKHARSHLGLYGLSRDEVLQVLEYAYFLTSSKVTAEDFVTAASEAASKFDRRVT